MKKYIILLIFLFVLSGCVSKPVIKDNEPLFSNQQQNSSVSMDDSNEPVKENYDLTVLNIKLPANWHLDTRNKVQYYFVDDKGEEKGCVTADKYQEDAFSQWQPNHSEITGDEFIDIPLGKCRLFTLDADNGTAASGITGTHDDYYAIIPLKDNKRYILEFSQNDKKPQTKEQFIKILRELSIQNSENDARVKHWIEDIDYLHENLPWKHRNLYHHIKKEEFNKEILALKNDVPRLKDFEIKCRLAQIVASAGDAHTSLYFNSSSLYPLFIWWYGDDLRVLSTDMEHNDVLGKKLTHINGVPISEIMKKVNPLISHENDQWLKEMNVQYVRLPDVLKFLGITSGDSAEFSFEDDKNIKSKFKFYPQALTSEKPVREVRVLDEMPVKPLRLQYDINNLTDNLYWFKYIPEDKILYFQYNKCIDKDTAQILGKPDYERYPDFGEFSGKLLKAIADNNIDKFVVDLRNNMGGNSSLMSSLAVKLAGIEKLRGKVYVMISRETFSAGVDAAVDLMKRTNAVFYGEPSGGNVNGYGDISYMVLPYSKLSLSYSSQYFNLSDKFKENFIPDVRVEETFNDYKNGIDDIYEAIKSR